MRDTAEAISRIDVVEADRSLEERLLGEADVVLNGERKGCSLDELEASCFAVERCADGPHGVTSHLQSIARSSDHSFVATTRRDAYGSGEGRERFVGCVSASQSGRYRPLFPTYDFEPDSLVLGNLCVARDYRNHGVGRTLVDRVLSLDPSKNVYLAVREAHSDLESGLVRDTLTSRAQRLHKAYDHMGFQVVLPGDKYTLFKYNRQGE